MVVEQRTSRGQHSELRQSIITGEWVVIATGRGKRPDQFAATPRPEDTVAPTDDPFADPAASGHAPDTLIYRDDRDEWTTRVFPNKYPILGAAPETDALFEEGPYVGMDGVGAHEVVVTRDPVRHLGRLDVSAVAEVIDAYQDRYLTHMRSRSVRYVSIFHNHGADAGASIRHPHSQILALPVVPLVVQREVDAVERFFRKNRVSPFAVMAEHEMTVRSRIVVENDDFMAFCPFASQATFNMWVMPKEPQPYFERLSDAKKMALAEVLQAALSALDRGLGDPAFNFFVHTAPCDGWDYPHYGWYIDIMPRLAKIAGLELATSMEVVPVTPEEAAVFLRRQLL